MNRRHVLVLVGLGLAAALLWAATTDDVRIWPVRNTLQYHVLKWWWARVGPPQNGPPGTLRGRLMDPRGGPIAGAQVLVARWDGTTYSAVSGPDGAFTIGGVPAGRYVPVAGAPGHADGALGHSRPPWWPAWPWAPWSRVAVPARRDGRGEARVDAVLPVEPRPALAPGTRLALGAPSEVTCASPISSRAMRRQVAFDSGGRPNQLTLLYTPLAAAGGDRLPTLLAVYPGPADGWECASLPLAAAGYAVVAAGPAYGFDLEQDVDELARLLGFVRARQLPGADGRQVALLAGSYSGLHVQRLLQRDPGVGAALLLGPPADLFDMRRRLEQGTFIPPFGLDRALIALGFPDREPLRYWRYSGAYHVRPDLPPVALIHSRRDEVVPFQQSQALAAALAAQGVPHELHLLEGASHYLLSEQADAVAIYRLTLDFLARHL